MQQVDMCSIGSNALHLATWRDAEDEASGIARGHNVRSTHT